MARRWVLTILLLVCSTLLVGGPAGAKGALTYRDLQVQVRTKTVKIPTGDAAGARVRCPARTYVLTGGAFFHEPGAGPVLANASGTWLASSYPDSRRSWYASGFNWSGADDLQLTVAVKCTPKKLQDNSSTESDVFAPGSTMSIEVSCSAGQAYTGGAAIVREDTGKPDPQLADDVYVVTNSVAAGGAWMANAVNRSQTPVRMFVTVLCTQKLAGYDPATVTTSENSAPAGGYLTCPTADERVLAGGVFWHQNGSGLPTTEAGRTIVSSSSPTLDAKGWYGDGSAFPQIGDHLVETITAECIPR